MFKDVKNQYMSTPNTVNIKAEKINTKGKVWFTADLHLGHTNILKFCPKSRQFADTAEMDEAIINSWNELVDPEDTVYVLGDVRFTKKRLEQRLLGKKHLILGNHDYTIRSEDWESIQHYKELNIDGKLVVMFHYPIETWNRQQYGALHLHGHTHGNNHSRPNTPKMPNRMDVGIDATGRTLISWEEVQYLINRQETK